MSFSCNLRMIPGGESNSNSIGSLPRARNFNLGHGLETDGKFMMQSLNKRLTSYLEKVNSLKKSNDELELKIQDWYNSRTDVSSDHSAFLSIISDLTSQIDILKKANANHLLNVGNAQLAAEDYRIRLEKDLALCRVMEAEILYMKKILDKSILSRSDLESEYEYMRGKLIVLTRNHREEIAVINAKGHGETNVCVDAAPSMDLNEAMARIRENQSVVEQREEQHQSWYQDKNNAAQRKVVAPDDGLQINRTKVHHLTSHLRKMQVELQTQQNLWTSLVDALEDKQALYREQLAGLQNIGTGLENHLHQTYANIAKYKLECNTMTTEITEYRRQLDAVESETHKVIAIAITEKKTVVKRNSVPCREAVDVDD